MFNKFILGIEIHQLFQKKIDRIANEFRDFNFINESIKYQCMTKLRLLVDYVNELIIDFC